MRSPKNTKLAFLSCVLAAVAEAACSSVPAYRPLPDGGDGGADTRADAAIEMNAGDTASADARDGVTDSPDATSDAGDGGDALVCVPACENYQACVNGRCTPRYVSTSTIESSIATVQVAGVAADGSYYVAGTFSGTVDFDPGIDQDAQTGPDSRSSLFVTRFTPDGSYDWTRTFIADENLLSFIGAIALDVAADGGPVVAGSFSGRVDFDPRSNAVDSRVAVAADAYVLKLTSVGGISWLDVFASQPGNSGLDVTSLDVAQDGSLILAGVFKGSADFDPGSTTDIRTATTSSDGYVAKLSTAGTVSWTRTIAGYVSGRAVTAADGVVWIAGRFSDSVDFDPSGGVDYRLAMGRSDAFVSRLTAAGAYLNTALIQSSDADDAVAIAAQNDGSVYISGDVGGTVDFDPGAGTQIRTGNFAMFVLHLGPDAEFRSVYIDPNQVSGYHKVRADDDGGVFVLDSSLGGSLFHLAGDTVSWRIPLPSNVASSDLGARAGTLVHVGRFSDIVDFDPGNGRDRLTSVSGQSFVSRYGL